MFCGYSGIEYAPPSCRIANTDRIGHEFDDLAESGITITKAQTCHWAASHQNSGWPWPHNSTSEPNYEWIIGLFGAPARYFMINKFPEFKKLELSDKVELEKITRQYLPYSDYHFTQMWIWDNHEPSMLSKLDGNIVIRHSDALTGESFYSFLGSNCLNSTIKTIFDFLNDANKRRTPLIGQNF